MKLIFLVLVALIACNSDKSNLDIRLPSCIEYIIQSPTLSSPLNSVQVQRVEGQWHYWLNTGNLASDGPEYIVDFNCDTVCVLCGECLPPLCNEVAYNGKWQLVWKR